MPPPSTNLFPRACVATRSNIYLLCPHNSALWLRRSYCISAATRPQYQSIPNPQPFTVQGAIRKHKTNFPKSNKPKYPPRLFRDDIIPPSMKRRNPEPDPSRKDSLSARTVEESEELDDFGIFPQTLIVATRAGWPAWHESFIRRGKMELQYGWYQLKSVAGRLRSKYSDGGTFAKAIYLRDGELKQAASQLHARMNTAIAEGDLATLKDVAPAPLFKKLSVQIESRHPRMSYTWRLLEPPHLTVLSNRIGELPSVGMSEAHFMQQAVVRIRSAQRLELEIKAMESEEQPGQQRYVHGGRFDELLVVQKLIYDDGEAEEWKVWGSTEETKVEHWDETLNDDSGGAPAATQSKSSTDNNSSPPSAAA